MYGAERSIGRTLADFDDSIRQRQPQLGVLNQERVCMIMYQQSGTRWMDGESRSHIS
jgi:hypothetical protein